MSTTRDMAGALNHRSGLTPIDDIARDERIAMDPLTSKGNEIMHNMEKEYGKEKGKKVFYASANKGTISGVHDKEPATKDGGPGSGPRPGGGKGSNLTSEHGRSMTSTGSNLSTPYGKHILEPFNGALSPKAIGQNFREAGHAFKQSFKGSLSPKSIGQNVRETGHEVKESLKDLGRGTKEIFRGGRDCDMTRDAMTNEEMEKWEKEKENAKKMAPEAPYNSGRYGGRGSNKAGSRDFTRAEEYNKAGTK